MKRIVIKVGTRVISTEEGELDQKILKQIVDQVVLLRKRNIEVVLITSGAVGAGKSLLSLKEKNRIIERQVFASIGQVRLMNIYSELFSKHGYLCAQVLVTKEDFRDKEHYFNMRNCFESLLLDNVIPIVNENDVIATTELLFTDNDELAALVASQLNADEVIILTSVDGVLDKNKQVIPEIDFINTREAEKYITPEKSVFGRGGMLTKFNIAGKLSRQGIAAYIVNGKKRNILLDLVKGARAGTKFMPQKKTSALKRRIAYSEGAAKGRVYVNKCAEDMLLSKERIMSLLPIGITAVEGNFNKGDIVEIRNEEKVKLGFGIAQYGSEKIKEAAGAKNGQTFIHYNYMFIG